MVTAAGIAIGTTRTWVAAAGVATGSTWVAVVAAAGVASGTTWVAVVAAAGIAIGTTGAVVPRVLSVSGRRTMGRYARWGVALIPPAASRRWRVVARRAMRAHRMGRGSAPRILRGRRVVAPAEVVRVAPAHVTRATVRQDVQVGVPEHRGARVNVDAFVVSVVRVLGREDVLVRPFIGAPASIWEGVATGVDVLGGFFRVGHGDARLDVVRVCDAAGLEADEERCSEE
jgi:hypothetical protein